MNKIKVDGKTYFGGSNWGEVTTERYQKLMSLDAEKRSNLLWVATAIYDIPYEFVTQLSTKQMNQIALSLMFAFSNRYLKEIAELELPDYFILNQTSAVRIPKNVGKRSVGQAICLRRYTDKLSEEKGEEAVYDTMISKAVAIYLQPGFTVNKFSLEQALEFEQLILKEPITLTYPVGSFLLKRILKTGGGIRNFLNLVRVAGIRSAWNFLREQGWIGLKSLQI